MSKLSFEDKSNRLSYKNILIKYKNNNYPKHIKENGYNTVERKRGRNPTMIKKLNQTFKGRT